MKRVSITSPASLFALLVSFAASPGVGVAADKPAGAPVGEAPAPATTTSAAAAPTPAKPAAPGGTTATWWGQSAWIINTPGGAAIAIDPWLDNPKAPKAEQPKALDAIL